MRKKMLLTAVVATTIAMNVMAQDNTAVAPQLPSPQGEGPGVGSVLSLPADSTGQQADAMLPFIDKEQLPKLIDIMPAPPAFESPEFANDLVRYGWGKQQRQDTLRLAVAIADAEWYDMTKLFLRWKDAFGLEISETATPEIFRLLATSVATIDPMRLETKMFYSRQRPFEYFSDTMPSHEEDGLRGEGSYPSGHSLRGWCISLILAQIAPQRATEIFVRGWELCDSRVVVGAHWQSDVDASRTAGSIAYCALQGSEAFIAQMKKAQAEYAEKMGNE
jgi:acid phosphatase (class A)